MKEAMFYRKTGGDSVQCLLCPHLCVLKPGQRGKCGVRENQGGVLRALSYAKACSTAIDPVEKKPLFHFLPGSRAFSVATVGCNFSCRFCQNWGISQGPKPARPVQGTDLSPKGIVAEAIETKCESIAYTYTEPTVFFEYAYDTARIASEKGIKNIFITNGFINPEAIDEISRYLDAVNVDLKGFSEEYYENIIGGRLKPVLDAVKRYKKNGVWTEVTTLIVPGHNDSVEMIAKMADFIASVDKDMPWHISRFYPHYQMRDTPQTDPEVIHKAVEIGKSYGIRHIYAGNVPGDDLESTYCPRCGRRIIHRYGFSVRSMNLDGKRCGFCGEKISMIQRNA